MPPGWQNVCAPSYSLSAGDMDSYSRFSNMVTEIIQGEVPLFEKSSIDEFYIDMTGNG